MPLPMYGTNYKKQDLPMYGTNDGRKDLPMYGTNDGRENLTHTRCLLQVSGPRCRYSLLE